jgi:predicted transcriptional regulator of viral defense system
VIIPVEYRASGIVNPQWYIDPLMKHLQLPYYVGLLSACEIHGASHQKPMVFQVITIQHERTIQKNGLKIIFYKKKDLSPLGYIKQQTAMGEFSLATVEQSILDLIAHPFDSGGLDNIATILNDLAHKLDESRLLKTIMKDTSIPLTHLQRLGFLLDLVGQYSKTKKLYAFIQRQHPSIIPLRPDRNWRGVPCNKRWSIAINAKVAPE